MTQVHTGAFEPGIGQLIIIRKKSLISCVVKDTS